MSTWSEQINEAFEKSKFSKFVGVLVGLITLVATMFSDHEIHKSTCGAGLDATVIASTQYIAWFFIGAFFGCIAGFVTWVVACVIAGYNKASEINAMAWSLEEALDVDIKAPAAILTYRFWRSMVLKIATSDVFHAIVSCAFILMLVAAYMRVSYTSAYACLGSKKAVSDVGAAALLGALFVVGAPLAWLIYVKLKFPAAASKAIFDAARNSLFEIGKSETLSIGEDVTKVITLAEAKDLLLDINATSILYGKYKNVRISANLTSYMGILVKFSAVPEDGRTSLKLFSIWIKPGYSSAVITMHDMESHKCLDSLRKKMPFDEGNEGSYERGQITQIRVKGLTFNDTADEARTKLDSIVEAFVTEYCKDDFFKKAEA